MGRSGPLTTKSTWSRLIHKILSRSFKPLQNLWTFWNIWKLWNLIRISRIPPENIWNLSEICRILPGSLELLENHWDLWNPKGTF